MFEVSQTSTRGFAGILVLRYLWKDGIKRENLGGCGFVWCKKRPMIATISLVGIALALEDLLTFFWLWLPFANNICPYTCEINDGKLIIREMCSRLITKELA